MAERRKQYYVLCAEQEDPDPPIVLLDMGEREEGGALAIAIYTAPEGEVQQEHLDRFARANEGIEAIISHITLDELLDVMSQEAFDLALLDSEEVPGSAFEAQIQEQFESLMRRRGASGWSCET